MKNNKAFLQVLIISIILFTACSIDKTNVSQTTETIQATTHETFSTQTLIVPTEGLGVVCGYLIDKETNQPPEAALFLSINIAAGREDVPALMSFSYQTNPRTEMAEDGHFCFEDVEPGVYALTLWSPPDEVEFVEDEVGLDYLWVEVEPNAVIDLGHISR
jgi:hypothetical protein